jgi:hypothetical protein
VRHAPFFRHDPPLLADLVLRPDSYPNLVKRIQSNIILLPELQEITNLPCDTGLERHELEADPELAGLDFSVLDQTMERHGVSWTSKKGFFDAVNVEKRAVWVKRWLRARPEEVIVGEFVARRGLQS